MTGRSRHVVCCLMLAAGIFLLSDAGWAHGVHGDHARALTYGGPIAYVWAGALHMLTGYDHLLFLFGVMFFLTKFRDIVAFITAFTLGHSLTLIGATLAGIQANYYLVDAVIAASVVYKGFENLDGFRRWFGVTSPNLLLAVFVFGLIHGFGLSTRLQDMGLPQEGLVVRLLSFNVGVELGQIAALAVMLTVLAAARRTHWFAPFSVMANTMLIIVGFLLFQMQMHGYLHQTYPDDFGFSTNQHILDHLNNDITGISIAPTPTDPTPTESVPADQTPANQTPE